MLDNTSKEAISKIIGVPYEELKSKIISEEETSVKIPTGNFFTDEQLASRDGNKFTDFKKDYEEQVVKKFRKDLGLEFEGKSFDNLFQTYEGKLKEKYSKDSTSRVKELEADLERVNTTFQQTETELKTKLSQLENQNLVQGIKNDLLTVMPKETTIPTDDVMTLFLSRHAIKKAEDGTTYLESNGTPLKDDKTASYLNHKDVFKGFVESYKKAPTGRGGENQNGNSGQGSNEDDFMASWSKQTGKPISSREGVDALIKYRQENKK